MTHTSGAGWYSTTLGQFEVTALSDGTRGMDLSAILRGITPTALQRVLRAHFLTEPYPVNFNAFLVNTGKALILVDTGYGRAGGPHLGWLLPHLEAAGYRPDEVDEILITHLHPDHIGGLASAGKASFPDATVRVARREADYWLDPDNPASGVVSAALAPYRRAGRFQPFADGTQTLAEGVQAVPLPGHTPGHTGYLFESDGHRLLAWGDVIHFAAAQFANPDITATFDWNQDQARATRERVLAEAASKGPLIAGAHLPFPGLGHVARDGRGYRWIPVDYVQRATPPGP
ncbi:MAG TPA: MBL fold metallo-hydrolase [Nevskiaceae bacterium]